MRSMTAKQLQLQERPGRKRTVPTRMLMQNMSSMIR